MEKAIRRRSARISDVLHSATLVIVLKINPTRPRPALIYTLKDASCVKLGTAWAEPWSIVVAGGRCLQDGGGCPAVEEKARFRMSNQRAQISVQRS